MACVFGPGRIDSLTGLYEVDSLPTGRFAVAVVLSDTAGNWPPDECAFEVVTAIPEISNRFSDVETSSCNVFTYDFDIAGVEQSGVRWSIVFGLGSIDSKTGVYRLGRFLAENYTVTIKVCDTAYPDLFAESEFTVHVKSCHLANNPGYFTTNTCTPITWDFDLSGSDQSGFRWQIYRTVGTIDSITGLYTLSSPVEGYYRCYAVVWPVAGDLEPIPFSFDVNVTQGGLRFKSLAPSPQVLAGDSSSQRIEITSSCGPVRFFEIQSELHGATLDSARGIVTYIGEPADADYDAHCMQVGMTDGTDTLTCDVCWIVIGSCPYKISISREHEAVPGQRVEVAVSLTSISPERGLGGFNLHLRTDPNVLFLQTIMPGKIVADCGWEYFTYGLPYDPYCCRNGEIGIVGIAETDNGDIHPLCLVPPYVGALPTTLATIQFIVMKMPNGRCPEIPVQFYWNDCRDNLITDASGKGYFGNCHIFDADKPQPIDNPLGVLPGRTGIPDACLNEDPERVIWRGVEFANGSVDFVCVDSVDPRGDINWNGLPFEVADLVMYLNYLLYGNAAFGNHVDGSRAASDINKDGDYLTLSDAIGLARIVNGESIPSLPFYPKPTAVVTRKNGMLSVASSVPLGGILLTLKQYETTWSNNENMYLYAVWEGERTRILATIPISFGQSIAGFEGELFHVGDAEIESMEMVDTYGGTIEFEPTIPTKFAVSQNYPNPFNPTTTISFDMPAAAEYTLTVHSVTGQVVYKVQDMALPGRNEVSLSLRGRASGVYFYTIEALGYSATRKAVLLK